MAHADEVFQVFYAEIERQFPLLPDAMVVVADTTGWGLAWYLGFRDGEHPHFAVRADYTLTFKTAAHEVGHAYEDTIWRLTYPQTRGDPMAAYWAARGFPGTYEEAIDEYLRLRLTGADPFVVWQHIPGESWAECFASVITGRASEWTVNYGQHIDIPKMRAFYESFLKEADLDRALFDAWFKENLDTYRQALQGQIEQTVYTPLNILERRVSGLETKAHQEHAVTAK